jgi:hypothetical protein
MMVSSVPCRLAAAVAKAERMLALAPLLRIDVLDVELVRRHVDARGSGAQPDGSSWAELDELIAEDIEALCEWFLVLERATERAAG